MTGDGPWLELTFSFSHLFPTYHWPVDRALSGAGLVERWYLRQTHSQWWHSTVLHRLQVPWPTDQRNKSTASGLHILRLVASEWFRYAIADLPQDNSSSNSDRTAATSPVETRRSKRVGWCVKPNDCAKTCKVFYPLQITHKQYMCICCML